MHNKKYFFKLVIIFIVAFILGASFAYYFVSRQAFSPAVQEGTDSVSIMFDYGNDKIDVTSLSIPTANATLFDVLKKASDDKKIKFNYKDYGGSLGIFIQSINEVAGTEERYWQYWVNNVYAQVGASSYVVQPGDIIIFKLIKSQM